MSVQAKSKKSNNNGAEKKMTRVQKNLQLTMLLNMVFGLLSVLVPLVPTASVAASADRTIYYSMIGAVNQDIGNADFRDDAFALLIVYVLAAVFMAVGCVGAYKKMRSSMIFTMGASAFCIVFMIMWFRSGGALVNNKMTVQPAMNVFESSLIPTVVLLFSLAGFISSVMALIYNSMDIPRKSGNLSR